MHAARWIEVLLDQLSKIRIWGNRASKISCADCPIVMSCGREPSENCLPRLEAMAGGRRRQVMPHDTMIVETTR